MPHGHIALSGSLRQGAPGRRRHQLRGCHRQPALRHRPAGGVHRNRGGGLQPLAGERSVAVHCRDGAAPGWCGRSWTTGLPTARGNWPTLSDNAPASISRVAELLERDAIIERAGPRGAIVSVDWKRLLHRWAVDYDFSSSNRMIPCLEPRGLPRLFQKLREAEFGYAVTGSFAGNRYAPRWRNPGWPPSTLRTLVTP